MNCWRGNNRDRWNATVEEANTAATLRKDVLAAIDASNMSEDVCEWAKWMVCRVSDESLERKVRRSKAEEWFKDVIATLKPGDTFTQAGILDTFHAPAEVANYAQFILTDWAYMDKYICYRAKGGEGLMQGAMRCNVYEVL